MASLRQARTVIRMSQRAHSQASLLDGSVLSVLSVVSPYRFGSMLV